MQQEKEVKKYFLNYVYLYEKWYLFNDEAVREMKEKELEKLEAYMLFYVVEEKNQKEVDNSIYQF